MSKGKILIEYSVDKLDKVFYEVRLAIHKVTEEYGYDESKLRIAIPKYFCDMLETNMLRHISETPFFLSDNKRKMFGIEVVPNYDNFIVVFHEDTPMILDSNYVVVDLK